MASCEKHGVVRRVVPAAAVTTHAKPHAQQQLARDLEVERAAQRCRPQSFGEVHRGNPQPRRWLDFWRTAANLLVQPRLITSTDTQSNGFAYV